MNMHAKLLKVKLIWLFMLFTFIPMSLIALYSYYNIKKQMIVSELSHLEAVAQLKAMQIQYFFNECKNDLQTIQHSPYSKEVIVGYSNKQSTRSKEVKNLYEQQLNDFIYNHDIDSLFIIGLEGNIIVSASQSRESKLSSFQKSAYEEGKTKIFFSEIYKKQDASKKENKNYYMVSSAPILDSNHKLIGVVVAVFNVNNFFTLIQNYTGLGVSGETLLGKKIGNEVTFLNPLRHDHNAGMTRRVRIDGKIAFPVINGATGHNGSGVSIDYRGVDILAAWRYIPLADWGLVAKMDEAEVLKPLESIRESIALTAFMLLIIGIAISIKMTHMIVCPVDKLEDEVHTDSLTGLVNRKFLMGLLDEVLSKAKSNNSMVGVMFLDLDGFKSVNDTYGHEMGDLLLKNVAQRLNNCVRQSDTVARLGGDEFIILLCDIKKISSIEKIADNIIRSVNKEYSINNHIVNVGVSIGISVFPDNATTADEMLRKADKAMYKAKIDGKNIYMFADA